VALVRGQVDAAPAAAETDADEETRETFTPGSPQSQAIGRGIAAAFADLARALKEAEAELGRIDAEAGDGDHGQGMARGSAAAAEAARAAASAGAGAASVLAAAGSAWADRAGGTSGAIWGLGLAAASRQLDDKTAPDAAVVSHAAKQALQAVQSLGGAQLGDKTLVDAFHPFVTRLTSALAEGLPLATAWGQAAEAATRGAEETAKLLPRLGRARPLAERSLGHRDAGAVSFALCSRIVTQSMGETDD